MATVREFYLYLRASARRLLLYPKIRKLRQIHVMGTDETIDYIIQNKCSIARFGDGEFFQAWSYQKGCDIMGKGSFQTYDTELGKRLSEILSSSHGGG